MINVEELFVDTPHFSFQYNGESKNGFEPDTVRNTAWQFDQCDGVRRFTAVYSFPFGIKVSEEILLFDEYDAVRVRLRYKNTSDTDSGMLSSIFDCDVNLPLNRNYQPPALGHFPTPAGHMRIFSAKGGSAKHDDFYETAEYIAPGDTQSYVPDMGGSSSGVMPYFDLNEDEKGILIAVGWSGVWNAMFFGGENFISAKTGIRAAEFYLRPGEEAALSSVTVMVYQSGRMEAHNKWRRFLREHVCNAGKGGRPVSALSAMLWGSMPSDKMVAQIDQIAAYRTGVEYIWVDAGWYGHCQDPCASEFAAGWGENTGSWNVNPTWHPDGMVDVGNATHANGMEFLLWFDPEMACRGTDWPKEHPDWFLELSPESPMLSLNLGNPEAFTAVVKMVTGFVGKLGIKCYRQDFNIIGYVMDMWRNHDEPGRKGITEIRHINNLYQYWDMLLARFPGLWIDDCAGGGRRLDIELISRAVPLWRSDYQ
ncbi:MAG: alpha-galactosidase, partial [Clostridia bacterium]|nr:alpha-galactosidase [Clostridia bacterium]